MCDRIAIIVKGRIVALDTVTGLKSAVQSKPIIEVTLADNNDHIETRRIEGEDVAAAARAALAQGEGQRIVAINTLRPTLEDVFVKLTGLRAEVMLTEKGGKGGGNAGG